ncbi:MAG TPA: aspartate aminotransferase family protein [bacterium]|mgnify:CR=1 FL=1|nr:aspartate aminotransferase family protein [bacterium]HPP11159.1 aspartate aminotransferase family protein [bacterium]
MTREEVKGLYQQYVVGSYTRDDVVLVQGRGSVVRDMDGREYLDFFPGWAVSGLGHCPEGVVTALKKQAGVLLHVSNNYYHPWQARLAERLSRSSSGGKVFFCNSGAEANEAAIKLCRLYGRQHNRYKIISMENSFHGRTLATVTLTGQARYSLPFQPLPEGFVKVPFNDFSALENAVDEKTVAVFLELIQGEGGINVADKDYVSKLEQFCRQRSILLVIDEIQTGFGRTGKMFAFQHYGLAPDIITLAKTMGGGFPIGAMIARSELASLMVPGTHASTFGGSPLACSAALAVLEMIEKKNLTVRATRLGAYLQKKLVDLKKRYPVIKEVRGLGLMLGMELDRPGAQLVKLCREKGLLVNCTHERVIRIMPGLTVKRGEIDRAISILDRSFQEFVALT